MVAWNVGVNAAEADCSRKNEDIDLPDFADEWQQQRDCRPDQVHRHQEGAPGKLVGEGSDDGSHADISHHLDGECRAEHHPRVRSGEFEGKKAERHGQQARAGKRDHLGREQVAVGAVGENVEHEWISNRVGTCEAATEGTRRMPAKQHSAC